MWKHCKGSEKPRWYIYFSEGGRQVTANPFSFMVSTSFPKHFLLQVIEFLSLTSEAYCWKGLMTLPIYLKSARKTQRI